LSKIVQLSELCQFFSILFTIIHYSKAGTLFKCKYILSTVMLLSVQYETEISQIE